MSTIQTPQISDLAESDSHAIWLQLNRITEQNTTRHRPTPRPRCDFPECPETAVTATGMCPLHKHVRVSGSWVDDKHADKGHG